MPDAPATRVPLARYTTLGVGGPAEYLVEVESPGELGRWLGWAEERGLPWLVLGHGSNVVVADDGVRGLVMVNRRRRAVADLVSEPADRMGEGCQLRVDGGAELSRLAEWTAARGLAGLEWAVGIPGTVAGAIVGNAGAMGGSMADVVTAITLATADGARRIVPSSDLAFGYRTSGLRQGRTAGAIESADLTLSVGEAGACQVKVEEYLAKRRAAQPRGRSAGCMFANPAGEHAGALLDRCGLKGRRCGDAAVSAEHANFIINCGQARATDVVALMTAMRRAVHEQFGIVLEPEVRLLGDIELEAV